MSFTYEPALLGETDDAGQPTAAALRNEVRFLIGDTSTDEDLQYAQDEEINFLVKRWFPRSGTAEFVASVLADTIASRYAGEASYSADGVSIGLGSVADQFRALAAALRAQHKALLSGGGPDAGGVSPGEGLVPGARPFDMGTGMHDNHEAGRQSFGSRSEIDYLPVEETGSYDA